MVEEKATRRPGQLARRGENKFLIRVFTGKDATGKKTYYNKTFRGSAKEAQACLSRMLTNQSEGKPLEESGDSVLKTVNDYLKDIARHKVTRRTLENYELLLKTHIEGSKLASQRISEVKAHDVQKFFNAMTDSGYSPMTVRHVHAILNPAFRQARKWEFISQNPCDLCELPKLVKKEMRHFTAEQVAVFLKHARNDRYYSAFLLAIELGLRPEELLGLQWKDVDWNAKTVSIRRGLIPLTGGGFEFGKLKTAKSRRTLPLSQPTVLALKEHRRVQLEGRLRLGGAFVDGDLLFPTVTGTPMHYRNFDQRHFEKIIKLANDAITKANDENGTHDPLLPQLRLYDLRHTSASLLMATTPVKVISERLGHATASMTLNTYSHVAPGMQASATLEMEKLMYGT